jgi:predicted HD phosphohydrolase
MLGRVNETPSEQPPEWPSDPPTLDALVALLVAAGTREEPNEEIPGLTVLHHGLQCASLLAASDPGDSELQLAGLLHDVGHILAPGREAEHGRIAAEFVGPVLGERVAAIIEGHVPAKRYLVSVDSAYTSLLSEGSVRTLETQGGSMGRAEAARFRATPHSKSAVRLRRADEAAKDPNAEVAPLEAWLPMLKIAAQ